MAELEEGTWKPADQSEEIQRLNDELAAAQAEAARLSLRLRQDGYTFKDIVEIAKGESQEYQNHAGN